VAGGVGYRALIVPEECYFSIASLKKIVSLLEAGFPVVWVGKRPEQGFFFAEWDTLEKRTEWEESMERIWADPCLIHVSSLMAVPRMLQSYGIFPRVRLEGTHDIVTAAHIDEEAHVTYYGVYAYNRFLYEEDSPAMFGYVEDTIKPFYQRKGQSSRKDVLLSLEGTVSLEEDELLVLAVVPIVPEEMIKEEDVRELLRPHRRLIGKVKVLFKNLSLRKFGPSIPEEKSYLRSCFSEDMISLCLSSNDMEAESVQPNNMQSGNGRQSSLRPWRELRPDLNTFVGQGIYEGNFTLPEIEEGRMYVLRLGRVSDTFTVMVNGKQAVFPDQVLKEVDITELVQTGKNQIQVTVTSNLYNAIVKEDGKEFFPMKRILRNYGIWEDEEEYCCVQVFE